MASKVAAMNDMLARMKPAESASDDDMDNSEGSSEDALDEKDDGLSAKRRKLDDEDDDDDDKVKTDDADEHSDSAALRQSKRKPSKSRIKRILPTQMPPGSTLSPEAPYPLPPVDSLMMLGATHALHGSQASMVAGPGQAYLPLSAGQQRTPGGYKCEVCGKEFRVPSRYDSHMLSHSKGKPFCCDVCGKLFASQQKLDIHKPVHSRDRKDSFECPQCGHKCSNWRSYLYHVTKHTSNGGKKHTCQVCGRQFHAAQRLRNHMQSHMEGKNFCCLICGKLFESQKRLDTHSLIHDGERQEPYTCVDCGKVYDDWRAFKQHMKTHGSDGVVYRCEICSAEFLTQYEKEKHKRVHTSNQRYQCQQCSKCFRSQSQLSVHERKHLGNKSHECMVCGRECARASSLKQHMKMHAGEEEFFCHLCGRTFNKAEELTVHAASHVGERDFACDQCGKCFAKKIQYHRHLVVHATGQPMSCGQCGKQFDQHTQLQAHMITHSNSSQKYACLACSDVFSSQLELEAHAHTHGKCPPYVCGLCGKLFAEQRYFRQHMKRHTARAQKQKLQAQASMTPTGMPAGGSTPVSGQAQGPQQGHKCHMCGQQFAQRHSLISHIEEHKRSGLLVYFNLIDGKVNKNPAAQKTQGSADASDDESESASESDGSDEAANRNKTTIHFGMESGSQPAVQTKGTANGGKSSLTQAAERAMALRMAAAANKQSHDSNPTTTTTTNNTTTNNNAGSGRSSAVQPEQGRGEGEMENNFYSAPVFPGQMTSSHATPYHAAAQQFQHNSQEDFMEGSTQGRGEAAGGHYSAPQKGLPGFADFRRQLNYANNSGYSDYQDSLAGAGQFSSPNIMPPPSGGYSSSGILPPASGFLPNADEQMPGAYSTSSSVPVYPDMSVFPGMPAQGHGDMRGAGLPQGSDMQQQFDPMLQFQPLSS